MTQAPVLATGIGIAGRLNLAVCSRPLQPLPADCSASVSRVLRIRRFARFCAAAGEGIAGRLRRRSGQRRNLREAGSGSEDGETDLDTSDSEVEDEVTHHARNR